MKKVSTSADETRQQAIAIGAETTIELIAGRHPSGERVVERLLVAPREQPNSFQLLKSPVFVRGIARADVIQALGFFQEDQRQGSEAAFKVLQHSGNLCIRVFSKQPFDSQALAPLEQALTAELEKLGGDLDVREQHVLVYSIHVSCGFNAIEKILDQYLAGRSDLGWYYGNVYDAATGEPLNWWQSILSQA